MNSRKSALSEWVEFNAPLDTIQVILLFVRCWPSTTRTELTKTQYTVIVSKQCIDLKKSYFEIVEPDTAYCFKPAPENRLVFLSDAYFAPETLRFAFQRTQMSNFRRIKRWAPRCYRLYTETAIRLQITQSAFQHLSRRVAVWPTRSSQQVLCAARGKQIPECVGVHSVKTRMTSCTGAREKIHTVVKCIGHLCWFKWEAGWCERTLKRYTEQVHQIPYNTILY